MNRFDQTAKLITENFGSKMLSDFRKEALRELNGTAFASLKIDNGPRLMIMLCISSPDQLHLIDNRLNIVKDPEPIDWDSTTMAQIFLHTAMGSGLSYEERQINGKRTALLLCATNPDSINLLERIFQFGQ